MFAAIDLQRCVDSRNSLGGTSVRSVEAQIAFVKKSLEEMES